MENLRIGFIGAGNMAQALVRGMLAGGALRPEQVRLSQSNPAKLSEFCATLGVTTSTDTLGLCRWADLVVLAVKPQVLPGVLNTCREPLDSTKLLLSVAAGTSIAAIAEASGGRARVVRSMPNTPSLVGEGATALCAGPTATQQDLQTCQTLLSTVGKTAVVTEAQMDAVTGLSGSGPAYVLTILEALADGAVRCGLPRATAQQFAIQTVLGTAKLAQDSQDHPAVLRDRVTSPAGTTAAGLAALEAGNIRSTVSGAVFAAAQRSIALGQPS